MVPKGRRIQLYEVLNARGFAMLERHPSPPVRHPRRRLAPKRWEWARGPRSQAGATCCCTAARSRHSSSRTKWKSICYKCLPGACNSAGAQVTRQEPHMTGRTSAYVAAASVQRQWAGIHGCLTSPADTFSRRARGHALPLFFLRRSPPPHTHTTSHAHACAGEIEVFNAYRVQHNNSRGPFKARPRGLDALHAFSSTRKRALGHADLLPLRAHWPRPAAV